MNQLNSNHSSTTIEPSSSSSSTTIQHSDHDSIRLACRPIPPPPSYAEAANTFAIYHQHHPHHPDRSLHRYEITHRFPSGLFVLRNRSSLKLLDVCGASNRIGTRLIAYPPKRPTLINRSLLHKENNQLFFLDWNGCLCSASSGTQVDVQDSKLILSQPTPISTQPSPDSHPTAQFKYDPITRTISVHFLHDPTFSNSTVEQINSVDYLLELQPLSSSSSSSSSHQIMAGFPLEKLSEWFPFGKPTSIIPSSSSSSSSSSNRHRLAHLDDQQQVDPDLDDSPHPAREVRVISIAPGWREKFPSSGSPEARKWLKRQWDIASIVVEPILEHSAASEPADHHRHPPSPPDDHSPPISSVLSDLGEALGDLGNEIFRAFSGSTSNHSK